MAYILSDEATYSFSYQFTDSVGKVYNRSLAGLNASNSATGQDVNEVFTKANSFFNLIYSPTGFSSIEGFIPKAVSKKINVGAE